jgi:transposase
VKMVDQPEYGTNTPYLTDFIKICLSAKLLNNEEIRVLYVEEGLSAAQIARRFGVAKSLVLARLHAMGIREGVDAGRSTNPENYRCRVAPYGYSIQAGKLVPSKSELRICRAVVDLIQRSGLSANAVAKELARRGYKNRAGRAAWDHSTVRSIFGRWKDKL